MFNEIVLLKTYLAESKSDDRCILLYRDKLRVVYNAKVDEIALDQIKGINVTKKKLIVPLILGGIGTSFSMLTLLAGWYHYQLNLAAVFMFFGVMYWGILGRKALEINVPKHRYVYLLKEDLPQVAQFLSFLNELRINKLKKTVDRFFHVAYSSDWKIAENSTEYSHPSLLEDGFVHCSRIEDLKKSYEIFFEEETEVMLLEIDIEKLIPEVVYVDIPSRDTNFPHVQGPINKTSIVSIYHFNSSKTLDEILNMYLSPNYS